MARKDESDPRIQMVSTWRPPLPPGFGKRRRWPRRLAIALMLLVAPVTATVVAGLLVFLDPSLPRLRSRADYHPEQRTRLLSPSGEQIGEVGDVARRVLPAGAVPRALERAVIAAVEPAFETRPPLTASTAARELIGRLRGEAPAPSIGLLVARGLTAGLKSSGLRRQLQEWAVAIRLERDLGRAAVLGLFLDEAPFGRGVFGVAEAARLRFGRAPAALDAAQVAALAELAGKSEGPPPPPPPPSPAAGCAAEAARRVRGRYDPGALAHLGADVVTPCDPELAAALDDALRRQRLERADATGATVVVRVPSSEVVAMVGDVEPARPIGAARAPLVLAAALSSLRFTAASSMSSHGGAATTLRGLAARSPVGAADALVDAGLNAAAVGELAGRSGLAPTVDAAQVLDGRAPVTPLEVASSLAMLASGGRHRLPQLIRSTSGVPESEGARATIAATSPEVAWLVTSLLPAPPVLRARIPGAAGLVGGDAHGAWALVYTPTLALVSWVGPRAGTGRADELERRAAALAGDSLAALGKQPATAFTRPAALVVRHLDGEGRPQHSRVQTGPAEWFVAASLPRELPLLPPDERP